MLNRIAFKLTLALGLLATTPALAWDPMPNRLGYFTAEVRILDTSVHPAQQEFFVALPNAPGDFCTASGGRWEGLAAGAMAQLGLNSSWINVERAFWSQSLAYFMAAKAQNLSMRVVMYASRGESCRITEFRTCTDAAACAVPGLPANP